MPLTNYGDLKTTYANWLARDDLTARIPEFIALGEFRLYSELRVRFMETSAAVAIVGSVRTTTLPTRWLQGKAVYVSGSPNRRLEYKTPIEYWAMHSSRAQAKPDVFTIEGENFLWGPVPDVDHNAVASFYQKPAPLANNTDTNGLFTLAPNLLLYAGLIEASPFLGNDARIPVWSALYEDLINKVHMADAKDRYSGDVRQAAKEAQRT